ncbi:hypothetical protein BIW11_02558 [Tropilaelaps mercedesae]|uniref:Uncharacterized protein n=1 Tax=Tropilaelaps mercedesae TaxID=418985 RepID=A0A1V9Y0W7_9ACAR|nr:hypothetical protein BIW11_02558 [Tropilaelaps mercedesae]
MVKNSINSAGEANHRYGGRAAKHQPTRVHQFLNLGTIFTEDMRELESVYEYVIREVHNKASDGRFRVNTTASALLTDDPFNLTREREYSKTDQVYHNYLRSQGRSRPSSLWVPVQYPCKKSALHNPIEAGFSRDSLKRVGFHCNGVSPFGYLENEGNFLTFSAHGDEEGNSKKKERKSFDASSGTMAPRYATAARVSLSLRLNRLFRR